MRFLERVPLGTPYPDMVSRVRAVLRNGAIAGRCTLVMEANGVGAPVLDLLRRTGLGCGIEAVIVTAGERESHMRAASGMCRNDLITGLRVMLENRELGLPAQFGRTRALIEELPWYGVAGQRADGAQFGASREGEHDDLVVALAAGLLAGAVRSMCGTRSLGLW